MAENDPAPLAAQPGVAPIAAPPGDSAAANPAPAPVAAGAATEAAPVAAAAPAQPAAAPADGAAADGAPAPSEQAEVAAEAPKAEPSLLETALAKDAEPPKPGEPEAPPAPATDTPAAYEFTLPEGVTANPEQMTAYTSLLGENKIAPEVGQKLIDLHASSLQAFASDLVAKQWQAFADTRREWRNQIMADEQLGGAGFETTKLDVAQARDLMWTREEQKQLNDFLSVTGAGDHPLFWRGLKRVAERLKEPASPQPAMKPPADAGKPPAGERRKIVYDNPRSRHSA